MQKENSKESIKHKILIYPAMTSRVNRKQIYFLFSLYQVEDILAELNVYDVPFSASFVEGVTVWRNLAIPVISLESYLGMKLVASKKGQRFIVIRSTIKTQDSSVEMRSAIRTEREIKMIPIPDSSELVKPNGWVNHELVKGIYNWDKGFIVVPEMDNIFQGEINTND